MVHKVSEHVQGKKSILIANANGDPKATRVISEQEGRQKAEELQIGNFYETNVLTGHNIKESLDGLAEEIINQRLKEDGASNINLNGNE